MNGRPRPTEKRCPVTGSARPRCYPSETTIRRTLARVDADTVDHYVLTVKANQPALRDQLKALPWKDVPATSTSSTSHGRRVRRTVKAITAPTWVEFPGAAQVVQVRRT